MRPFTILIAVLAVVFSFGIVGPASAAQGGNGNANNGKSDDAASSAAADTSNGKSDAAQDNGKSDAAKSDSGTSNTAKTKSTKSDRGDNSAGPDHSNGTAGTSGNPDEEQPVSPADDNDGGANGQCSDEGPDDGPYCSTRHGAPSTNGNGDGQHTGRPCAGCVGKADNKNPPGQEPNAADDGNNGYECDNNNGIGKENGNPAHTSCTGEDTPTTAEEPCVPKANEYVDEDGNCVKKTHDKCVPKGNEYIDEDGNCVVKTDDNCVPKGDEVLVNGKCVTPTCPEGTEMEDGTCTTPPVCPDGSEMQEDGTCANGDEPVCPKGTTQMEDDTCVAPAEEFCPGGKLMPASGQCNNGNNRPAVAGVEAFAGTPPAAVEQFAGPAAPAGAPTGILPMTGADGLMNALGAAGMGLLVLGGATLLMRRRTTS